MCNVRRQETEDRESYRQLVRLGVHLIETDRDLTALKETIDGLTEAQAKEMLTVSVAEAANYYAEQRNRADLN